MSAEPAPCDVLVVGAGPVGLLLGCLLAQRGIDVRVLERRGQATERSRAIGVHPPGLACMAQVGLAEPLIERGVRVRRGCAFVRGANIGSIDFATLNGPFDFVLSVPQPITERLLQQRLHQLAPNALMRGVEVAHCGQDDALAGADVRDDAGLRRMRARFVVGCDGRRSVVRDALKTPYPGRVYPQRFAMADLPDETTLGSEAAVFVDHAGLVESFPLPGGRRRWVASLERSAAAPSRQHFAGLLEARTGLPAYAPPDTELSLFAAERFCAERFARGRLVLAGDAAHVISPIGGQGMNLGWQDASALAELLPRCLAQPEMRARLLADYSRSRRRATLRAAQRSELYMALGFAAPLALRRLGLWALTRAPIVPHAARVFTMQGAAHAFL